MKKLLIIVFLLFAFCKIGFSQQSTTARNVEDYYLLLPVDYFMCDVPDFNDSPSGRIKSEKVKDLKNGYIEAETATGNLFVVLYKNRILNKDIIALSLDCGPGCMCSVFTFMEYTTAGEWAAVEVIPWEPIETYVQELSEKGGMEVFPSYVLPQYGTTIIANDYETKKKLFELKWDGQKFSLVKPQ
jgi:hypothetical protein